MRTALFVFTCVLFTTPISVSAASDIYVENVWNYPDRVFGEIDSWFSVAPTPPDQVLGAADLTGRPIIEEQTKTSDLTTKLDSSGSSLEQLYLDYQEVEGEAVLMGLKWDSLTVLDVTRSIDKLNVILNDTHEIDWLRKAWGWSELDGMLTRQNEIMNKLAVVRSIVSTSGMVQVAYDQLKLVVQDVEGITTIVGEKTDPGAQATLYGHYNHVRNSINEWDNLLGQLEMILAGDASVSLSQAETKIITLNRIPNVNPLLAKDIRNRTLDLVGVVTANKILLAQDRGAAIVTTWLQQDPMEFKTLVSNTSLLARQEVAVKYYLPPEIKEGDIKSHDPNLLVKLDPDRQQYFVEGGIVVAAGDTRTMSVETADIWQFDLSVIDASRSQATDLTNFLADSPNFVRAVALKGNIETLLKSMADLQTQNMTPQQKITSYRQTVLQMDQVGKDLDSLRTLASQPSSPWQGITNWTDLAMVGGGVALIVLGIAIHRLLSSPVSGKKRTSAAVRQFNIFTSDIASSDL